MARAEELRKKSETLLDIVDQLALQHALLQRACSTLETAEDSADLRAMNDAIKSVHTLTETISSNIERHHKITQGSTLNLAGEVRTVCMVTNIPDEDFGG